MSLTVDAAPPGAPAVPGLGPSARSLPTGIAALFAALLAGQITADAATGTEGDTGAHGKTPASGTDERRPDDPTITPTPDPNTLALLVPPIAINVPPAPPNAALTKTTEYKTTEKVMDTALSAPALPETQKDGGLLFPTHTEQTPGLTTAAPAVTPAVTPAVQNASTMAPAVTPAPASVRKPAVTSAAAQNAASSDAAPASLRASSVPASPHPAQGAVPLTAVPSPAQGAVPPSVSADAPGGAKTDTMPALKKSAAPANNTGRSLAAAPQTEAAADAVGIPVAQAAAPSAADAHEPLRKAGTGPQMETVPAQASTATLHTAQMAPVKTETQNTAARQVADEVVNLKLAPGAARQVTVNLHPREWGSVRVQVTMAPTNADGTAGAVTAHLTADSPQARTALEASSGDLKRALHDAGLRLETLTISAGDTVQAASQSAGAGNGSPSGQDGSQNAFAAFAGTGGGQSSTTFGGGQGSGNRPGGQSGPSSSWRADTDNHAARPETPRTSPTQGVDIRA